MNADEQMKKREQISALADGQLQGIELAAAMDLAASDDDARANWHLYHLVGDVLRSGELAAPSGHDRDFVGRLRGRLEAEPAAPRRISRPPEAVVIADAIDRTPAADQGRPTPLEAANDSSLRWKWVAGLASLAAVAAIGWNALGALSPASGGSSLAQARPVQVPVPAAATVAASPSPSPSPSESSSATASPDAPLVSVGAPAMIRDARLDELMAAHRQFGGTSALQKPSGFLRNATFEGAR